MNRLFVCRSFYRNENGKHKEKIITMNGGCGGVTPYVIIQALPHTPWEKFYQERGIPIDEQVKTQKNFEKNRSTGPSNFSNFLSKIYIYVECATFIDCFILFSSKYWVSVDFKSKLLEKKYSNIFEEYTGPKLE